METVYFILQPVTKNPKVARSKKDNKNRNDNEILTAFY